MSKLTPFIVFERRRKRSLKVYVFSGLPNDNEMPVDIYELHGNCNNLIGSRLCGEMFGSKKRRTMKKNLRYVSLLTIIGICCISSEIMFHIDHLTCLYP